jgi:AcrR family transcriptional regulator
MVARERFDVVDAPVKRRRARVRANSPDAGKYETRRIEIAEAAVEPLNRHGVRGMTVADVASRLGLAPTAVGYYFKGKEDLAATCYFSSISRLQTMANAAKDIQTFIRDFFEFRRRTETGEENEIAWFEDVRTISRPDVNAAYIEFFRKVRGLVARAHRGGRAALNIKTHQLLSQLYWAVGFLPAYHPDDYSRVADRFIDILENGLAAKGRKWAPKDLSSGIQLGDDEDRRDFLRAATDLINAHGYRGASVQKISEQVNVTKGSFYHHHSAKNDMVFACFQQTWDNIRRAQHVADELTSNGLDNLASLSAYLIDAHMTGAMPMLRAAALAAVPAELRPELVAGFQRSNLYISSVISDGIGDGSIRPVDVPIASQMVNGAINASAELQFWAPDTPAAEATDLYIRPLFTGLLADSA